MDFPCSLKFSSFVDGNNNEMQLLPIQFFFCFFIFFFLLFDSMMMKKKKPKYSQPDLDEKIFVASRVKHEKALLIFLHFIFLIFLHRFAREHSEVKRFVNVSKAWILFDREKKNKNLTFSYLKRHKLVSINRVANALPQLPFFAIVCKRPRSVDMQNTRS